MELYNDEGSHKNMYRMNLSKLKYDQGSDLNILKTSNIYLTLHQVYIYPDLILRIN